jgi:hypothetical protein
MVGSMIMMAVTMTSWMMSMGIAARGAEQEGRKQEGAHMGTVGVAGSVRVEAMRI